MPYVEEVVTKEKYTPVREKKTTKPSKIELLIDGMRVLFAYHDPVRFFFNTFKLKEWINGNEPVFKEKDFHIKRERGNRVTLVLHQPVRGHTRMTLPRNVFADAVNGMFEKHIN